MASFSQCQWIRRAIAGHYMTKKLECLPVYDLDLLAVKPEVISKGNNLGKLRSLALEAHMCMSEKKYI